MTANKGSKHEMHKEILQEYMQHIRRLATKYEHSQEDLNLIYYNP